MEDERSGEETKRREVLLVAKTENIGPHRNM